LASATVPRVEVKNDEGRSETTSFLLLLARSDEDSISSSAIRGLVRLDPALENDQSKQLVVDRLHSTQFNRVLEVMQCLTAYALEYPPEVFELLLHGDPQQQTILRSAFVHTVGPWKPRIALSAALTKVLKDDAKAADHLSAIRALAAQVESGRWQKSDTRNLLEEIVEIGKLEHQVAAAFALQQITRGQTGAAPLLGGKARDAAGQTISAPEIQALLEKEKRAVFGGRE
jgi:hypothetical protein